MAYGRPLFAPELPITSIRHPMEVRIVGRTLTPPEACYEAPVDSWRFEMARVAILIVAAGKGERAGGAIPKQYVPLLGRPMLRWTASCFAGHPLLFVIGADQAEAFATASAGLDLAAPVLGGPTRQDSVRRDLGRQYRYLGRRAGSGRRALHHHLVL